MCLVQDEKGTKERRDELKLSRKCIEHVSLRVTMKWLAVNVSTQTDLLVASCRSWRMWRDLRQQGPQIPGGRRPESPSLQLTVAAGSVTSDKSVTVTSCQVCIDA